MINTTPRSYYIICQFIPHTWPCLSCFTLLGPFMILASYPTPRRMRELAPPPSVYLLTHDAAHSPSASVSLYVYYCLYLSLTLTLCTSFSFSACNFCFYFLSSSIFAFKQALLPCTLPVLVSGHIHFTCRDLRNESKVFFPFLLSPWSPL